MGGYPPINERQWCVGIPFHQWKDVVGECLMPSEDNLVVYATRFEE